MKIFSELDKIQIEVLNKITLSIFKQMCRKRRENSIIV